MKGGKMVKARNGYKCTFKDGFVVWYTLKPSKSTLKIEERKHGICVSIIKD